MVVLNLVPELFGIDLVGVYPQALHFELLNSRFFKVLEEGGLGETLLQSLT